MQAEREARENVTPSLPEDTLWMRFAFVDPHVAVARAQAAMARELPPQEVAATAAELY